jgi:S-formylglutathione hydrolase FrmB
VGRITLYLVSVQALVRLALAAASLVALNCIPSSAAAQAGLPRQAAERSRATIVQGRLVADTFWSAILTTRKRVVVYLPPSYAIAPTRRYAVAYYLHGAYGGEDDWTKMGRLNSVMDSLAATGAPEMIVVMPDGDDGWYTTWNSLGNLADCTRAPPARERAATYCVPWPKYDDYIARDLVAHVDSFYRTLPTRAHRGIAGLSMGGYGAVSLALRYDDVFSAAASHSGVLAPLLGTSDAAKGEATDVDSLRARWSAGLWPALRLAFGGRDLYGWTARDPARMAKRALARGAALPPLLIDAGKDDPFTPQSRAFVVAARALGGRVTYREWPGKHDWDYWRAHVGESLVWLGSRIAEPR